MAKKPSHSPDRGTFQRNAYLARTAEKGKPINEAYLQMWDNLAEQTQALEQDLDWQKNNLEWDLRTTDWILNKARASESYAQNIYAAMCNMRWQKRDVFPILADQYWSCSWRSAGGIVADMLVRGDYIDWYCSGMGGVASYDAEEGDAYMEKMKYVSEGTVTEEIKEDFYRLGWTPSEWPEDDQ